jgi:predicted enzyme related to lactoylglutathione lyase
MARVLGVGGVFFKSEDPDRLYQWYDAHLGIKKNDGPGVSFMTSDLPADGYVVWTAFKPETQYFDPATKQYMFNFIVDDLDGALEQVQAGGAELIGEVEAYENGRFGWFMDPEGNKVELWEPKLS